VIKRETPFLLCEAICEAIRQRLPEALASDCTFFFDYEGLTPITTVDPSTIHAIVDRLLRYSLRTLREGVFFRVTVQLAQPEQCRVALRLATVARADPPEDSRLQSPAPDGDAGDDADIAVLRVLCAALGGDLQILSDPVGFLVQARFLVPILEPALSLPDVQADGASAWLVSSPPFVMKMLARRLQRLGWRVRLFASIDEVERGLQMEGSPPSLLIGSAHRGFSLADATRVRARLAPESRIVLQVLQRMTLEGDVAAGIEVHAVPLSPRRLMHYTEMARQLGQHASGDTEAGTLEGLETGVVLVVDDNPVNRILFEEMVRMLGYRVTSVVSGEAAIESCLAERPLAVLMDLHMPGMGGLAAAGQLRALQASGRLGAFGIWAVSADSALSASVAGGSTFDGAIPKPVSIQVLRAALSNLSHA
jgi:CheY-like chemotaxis protein